MRRKRGAKTYVFSPFSIRLYIYSFLLFFFFFFETLNKVQCITLRWPRLCDVIHFVVNVTCAAVIPKEREREREDVGRGISIKDPIGFSYSFYSLVQWLLSLYFILEPSNFLELTLVFFFLLCTSSFRAPFFIFYFPNSMAIF